MDISKHGQLILESYLKDKDKKYIISLLIDAIKEISVWDNENDVITRIVQYCENVKPELPAHNSIADYIKQSQGISNIKGFVDIVGYNIVSDMITVKFTNDKDEEQIINVKRSYIRNN